MKRTVHIGLTGGIASGKSTVTVYLRDRGYPVIDADQTAHQLMEAGGAMARQVAESFGPDFLTAGGAVDRKRLGELVFQDPEARARLNALSHPLIQASLEAQAADLEAGGAETIFFDVPLLLEVPGLKEALGIDQVWLVYAEPDLQKSRLMARDGLSAAEAQARMASQMDLEEKKSLADVVVYNQSNLQALHANIDEELRRLSLA